MVSVKVKVVVPAAIPVTEPVLSIEAIAPLLLTHVPPEEGNIWIVFPIQTAEGPETAVGVKTFTVAVAAALQPPLVTV